MGKITDEELKRIESVKNQTLEVASILGELNYQKMVIEDQIDQQKTTIRKIKSEEFALFEELKSKYGNVSINIHTGEFN